MRDGLSTHMKEWSPYGINPPHLDGFFRSTAQRRSSTPSMVAFLATSRSWPRHVTDAEEGCIKVI